MEMIGLLIWLKPLGWALFHSIWQGATLYLLCRCCFLVLKGSNLARYWIAYSGLSLLFLLFATTYMQLICQQINHAALVDTFSSADLSPLLRLQAKKMNVRYLGGQFIAAVDSSLVFLVPLYLTILGILSVKMVRGLYELKTLRDTRLLSKPEEELLKKFNASVQRMGIDRSVFLFYSSGIRSPLTLGFLKPFVLLPLAFLSQLSADQVEAVLYHELFHIKRNDYLFNLIQAGMETLLFFNPFTGLFSSMIRAERENCCDENVLKTGIDAISYANALVCLEENRQAGYKLTLGIRSGSSPLLDRIRRITGNPAPAAGSFSLLILMITVCSGILSFSFISGNSRQQPYVSVNPVSYLTMDTLPLRPLSVPLQVPVIKAPPATPAEPAKPAAVPEKRKKFPAPPRPPKISSLPEAVNDALTGLLKLEFTDHSGHKRTITINADTLISPDGEIRIFGRLNEVQLKKIQKDAIAQARKSMLVARKSLRLAEKALSAQYRGFEFQDKFKLDSDLKLKSSDSILHKGMLDKLKAEPEEF